MTAQAGNGAPLDDVMLAMDVVDTLRHDDALVRRELNAPAREAELIERLRAIYRDQGIAVPDHILRQGVAALAESRFTYSPPPDGWKTRLARLYVTRERWGRRVGIALAALALVLGGYFLVYRPIEAWQADQARAELEEGLPARMEALYQAIFTETKVQSPLEEARSLVERGEAAAARGDREGALSAIARLERIEAMLLAEFSLRIVDREGEPTGVWRFPEESADATNYYIVVEAIAPDGDRLTLPIESEETGEITSVDTWAVRVPEVTYEAVRADRLDDGIIQRNVLGAKAYGFLDIDYVMPVLGGAITEW
ncbi:DUF6384 family protein [Pelagibacterium montanilacus]|uniref:DUF6384 family protein n=1 Tax=Pelagibacterium montanilacus TaxID=2185280 RepID=UPI000F8D3A15|nr:DUF6384 family protein [Pelagibacterium montanilacus]